MLLRLNIKNFAILKDVEIDLENGMTLISGESGSGKSMILEAIQYLVGKRATTEIIRHGEEKAIIEGVFDFPNNDNFKALLNKFDIEEDELYIVKREVMLNKKSIIKINSHLITLQNLRTLMAELISIHSQKESTNALGIKQHRKYLDQYINLKELDIYKEYEIAFQKFKSLTDEINELEYKDKNRVDKLEIYKQHLVELNNLNIDSINEDDIIEQVKYMKNSEDINHLLQSIQFSFYSERSVTSELFEITENIDQLIAFDRSFEPYKEPITSAYHLLNDLNQKVSDAFDEFSYDEATFNQLQSQLNDINRLKRKHNKTFEELVDYKKELENNINQLENISQSFTDLKREKENAFKEIEHYAAELHQYRMENKHFLENRIKKELHDLDMKHADFEIKVTESKFNSVGYSQVEFFISPNKGEPLKELNKSASGGELSRINLAIKIIFAEMDSHTVIILDEIDSGVSGFVATKMAGKIRKLSKFMQVICISHLAQTASIADNHLSVHKITEDNRTFSKVTYLDDESHIHEIARMISGTEVTQEAINNAKTLLNETELEI